MSPVESVLHLFSTTGTEQTVAENISHLSHALGCATLAERSGAKPHLVASALLHNVGSLLDSHTKRSLSSRVPDDTSDIGYHYLAHWFVPEVVQPIRLQSDADRLLCAVDMDYFVRLTADAVAALVRRGGPMNQAESSHFVDHPFADDAVKLRRWHQQAKSTAIQSAELPWFRRYLESSLLLGFQVA